MVKKKKSQQSRFRTEKMGMFFGDTSLSDFIKSVKKAGFNEETLKDIATHLVAAFVAVVWLVQIRSENLDKNSQQVEQLPSFKKIKKGTVFGSSSPVVFSAAAYAVSNTIAFAQVSNEEELTNHFIQMVDSYSPNSKHLDKPNERNYVLWCHGYISRHVGLFSSCPATNMKIFNLPKDVKDWTIKDVVGRMGDFSKYVTPDSVRGLLINGIFYDEGGYPVPNLVFNEPVISPKMEADVLAGQNEYTIVRNYDQSSSAKMSSQESNDLIKYLTKVEVAKLEQAKAYGLTQVVNSLLQKAKKLKEEAETGVSSSGEVVPQTEAGYRSGSQSSESVTQEATPPLAPPPPPATGRRSPLRSTRAKSEGGAEN